MHSILESDGATSDPYEVLCHMGILIIEGRTPKAVGDATASGEPSAKSTKPYNEGPHCPNFMKFYNKDTHNVHKCTENNMFCIRYNNLKQSLLNFQSKSPSVCIEVSLGPDCLCGELRSQSTLVSSQPSKRDVVLEQWTITIGHKQIQESSSQMSVMNLYQAVRSLLHFSQLTAWYMSNNGMKPAHVIYRVGVPEDSTFIGDENFVNHDFPVADVNKTVWMKISVKTLPRMEKIPSVYCPQHPSVLLDAAQCCSHFEGKEPAKLSKEKVYLSPEVLHSKFSAEAKGELLESKLPLKFQGVRKKTSEVQERKRKKHITLYGSSSSLEFQNCPVAEFLDGIPVDMKKPQGEDYFGGKRMFQRESLKSYQGESSKAEYKKPKSSVFPAELSELVKPQSDFGHFDSYSCNYFEQKVVDPTLDLMIGLNSLSDSKRKSDFRTKVKSKANASSSTVDLNSDAGKKKEETKTVMDILDDRMQISCAISGKHHCKWECEEENDLCSSEGNVEKPKRRRSLSKVGVSDGADDAKGVSRGSPDFHLLTGFETEKILHGKFKEVDGCKSALKEKYEEEEGNELFNSKALFSFPSCSQVQDQSSKAFFWESPPRPTTNANVDISCNNLSRNTYLPETPISLSLPLESGKSEEDANSRGESSECSERLVEEAANADESGSSRRKPSPEAKENPPRALTWVRTESLEAFKRGCAIASSSAAGYSSDSEAESSDGYSETSNPFLAAILRTTRKSKSKLTVKRDSRSQKICDSILKEKVGRSEGKEEKLLGKGGLFLEKLKDPMKSYVHENIVELKAKVEVSEKQQSNSSVTQVPFSVRDSTGPDLKSEDEDSDVDDCSTSKSLTRVHCHFDKQDLKQEERISDGYEDLFEESGNGNANSIKTIPVPSAHDKLKFRRSLDSAAQLVFHRCSGLPLTSSPAPVRRNNSSFSFDSSLNSVSAIKSALFEPSNSLSSEDENESEGSLKSPASPGAWSMASKQINYHSLSPLPLLGSFEESVLNGRLEPVSTVQGFTAELGASGSFCPPHLYLPVTVFFYTLGDNDKVSAPYLGHINLGKKGYNVPRSGTIQVTLFNPLRTVVKMFVVVYDLHDMPVNSHTFLRQRTLYVPASQKESTYTDKKETPFEQEDYHKYLRYLIHLRFVSGKTGRIYLHTDIRMVIFRKADEDTATALGNQSDGQTYELRSHTHGPMNPKFSPRK